MIVSHEAFTITRHSRRCFVGLGLNAGLLDSSVTVMNSECTEDSFAVSSEQDLLWRDSKSWRNWKHAVSCIESFVIQIDLWTISERQYCDWYHLRMRHANTDKSPRHADPEDGLRLYNKYGKARSTCCSCRKGHGRDFL